MADHAQSTNFFVQAVGVVHIPGARDQLRGDGAGVCDGDGVRKYIERCVWVRLLGQVLGVDFDLKRVTVHGTDFDASPRRYE